MITVAIVLGTSVGGVGTHVRSVVDRLPPAEFAVTVVGPPETDDHFGFTAAGARFVPVRIAASPRPDRDLAAVRAIRRALRDTAPDVVHAHGFRAAALTGLALGRRRPGRVPFVATWHNAVLGGGPRRRVLALLEALAARRADLTLGASEDLVDRAAALGAPVARSAPVAAPALPPPTREPDEVRRDLGAVGRPLVLAVGRLAPQKDYRTLLEAARLLAEGAAAAAPAERMAEGAAAADGAGGAAPAAHAGEEAAGTDVAGVAAPAERTVEGATGPDGAGYARPAARTVEGATSPDVAGGASPAEGTAGGAAGLDGAGRVPVVVIAGDGPERDDLQATIDRHQLPVELLGHRDDVADLLHAADVYVLSSLWEARALVVQEAMRAGTPVVATDVGGIPELTGDGEYALVVPPRDPPALAAAMRRLLGDESLRSELADRARVAAETWPDEGATATGLARLYRQLAARD